MSAGEKSVVVDIDNFVRRVFHGGPFLNVTIGADTDNEPPLAGCIGLGLIAQKGQDFALSWQGTGPRTNIRAKATTIPGTVTAAIFDRFKKL